MNLKITKSIYSSVKLQKVFTLVSEKEKNEIKSKFVFNQRANGNHKTEKIYLYALL